jgi:hypothetical protein
MIQQSKWGGKRKGAGRPKAGKILAVERTKVIRVDNKLYELIRAGWIDHLIARYQDWSDELDSNPKHETSPRWERFKQFRDDVRNFPDS